MAKDVGIQVVGRYDAERMIGAIINRVEYPGGAGAIVFPMLEGAYEEQWDEWGDYLYETGATKEAFTDSGALHAIRNIHGRGIEFGSSLGYNRFFAPQLLGVMDTQLTELVSQAMAIYMVPVDPGEPKPSWYRPRDPKSGRFIKRTST